METTEAKVDPGAPGDFLHERPSDANPSEGQGSLDALHPCPMGCEGKLVSSHEKLTRQIFSDGPNQETIEWLLK
jgi:hypothetical protein